MSKETPPSRDVPPSTDSSPRGPTDQGTEEELKELENSVIELQELVIRRRSLFAYGIFALIIFIVVQFFLVIGLCLPTFHSVNDDRLPATLENHEFKPLHPAQEDETEDEMNELEEKIKRLRQAVEKSDPTPLEKALADVEARLAQAVVSSEGGGQTEEKCDEKQVLNSLKNLVKKTARNKANLTGFSELFADDDYKADRGEIDRTFGHRYGRFLKDIKNSLKSRIYNSKGVTGTAQEVGIALKRLETEIWNADWYHRRLN